MTKRYTFRKLINDLHLWLGIGSGIILFVVCLTGTILTFDTELSLWLDKGTHYSKKEGNKIPITTIINTIEKDKEITVKEVIFYGEENRNYTFTTLTKEELKKPSRGTSITINPYTGKQVIAQSNVHNFIHTIEELHRFLLLDKTIGRPIVGVSTIIFIFMCFSGLILWFPKKIKKFKNLKVWKQGFTIKTNANWKRINYDIHNTLGFYALIPLLLMGLTGLLWSFTWYYNGLEKVLGDKLGKSRFDKTITIESAINSPKNIAYDYTTILKKTDSILNYKNFATRVTFPLKPNESIMVRKKSDAFLAFDAADKLQFNPYNNALISKSLFKDEKLGSKIASLIRAIHVGSFAGITTKILYFICCLIATSLPITGTLIWLNKRKNKLHKKSKRIY